MLTPLKRWLVIAVLVVISLFALPSVVHAASYTVQPGDTLSKIAPNNWQVWCNHNQLPNCDLIYVGQVLDIPDNHQAILASATPTTALPGLNQALASQYAWGGSTPLSLDCSGLTQWLSAQRGFSIPRTSGAQAGYGRSISRSELQNGDIVVMNGGGHVGLYVGNGQLIHALNPSEDVKIHNLDYALKYNPLVSYRAVGH